MPTLVSSFDRQAAEAECLTWLAYWEGRSGAKGLVHTPLLSAREARSFAAHPGRQAPRIGSLLSVGRHRRLDDSYGEGFRTPARHRSSVRDSGAGVRKPSPSRSPAYRKAGLPIADGAP